MNRAVCAAAALTLPVALSACLEQFDRSKINNQYHAERVLTAGVTTKLSAAGELPSGAVATVPVGEKFKTYCSSCHGEKGEGNGPASVALNPKPRNFTDAAWQGKTDDARIASVIKNGGASVGLSAVMAPWGGVFSDDEIKELVGYVRHFKP